MSSVMETMVKKMANGVLELSETTLGEIASFEMGQAPPGADCNMEGRGTVFVKAGEFGDLYTEKKEWTTKPLKYGKDGDVFICVVGATTGKLNLGIDCAIGRSVAAIRPNAGYDARFVYYQLLPSVLRLRASSAGSAQGVLSKKQLSEIPFVVAPLPEQRRIVEAIELQLGRLDAAVARLHAAKAKLKRYRQAVLKAAFSGNMTAGWRMKTKVTPVDKMLSRIETPPRPSRYKSRSMDVVDGDYALAIGAPERQGPPGWKWVPLVDIARLESGHTPSKRHPEYWDGDIPWIELRDARDRHGAIIHTTNNHTNQLGLDNSAARLLPEGTVCLSRTASVGYVVKMGAPMCTSQDFVNWVCTEAIDPDWLKLLFVAEHDAIWRFGKGTTHTTVYFPEVVSFHVLLPPIEEQREMVRLVDEALTTTEEIETTLDTQLAQAVRLRQSVLKRAFEGRLV